MKKKGFSSLDIERGLKIPSGRFRAWLTEGFIRPSVPAEGQGSRAWYTIERVYSIKLFAELLARGFQRKVAAALVEELFQNSVLIENDGYRVAKAFAPPQFRPEEAGMRPLQPIWITHVAFGFLTDDENEKPFVQILQLEGRASLTLDEDGLHGVGDGPGYTRTIGRGEKQPWRHLVLVDFRAIMAEVDEAMPPA